jgi:putative MATE family efflux protein
MHITWRTHHQAALKAKHEVDMTQGNVARHLIAFALPLLAGNIFQQLYNTVDTWVVGNYVSNEAFSAVGTVSPIINTLIGFFMGLASGAGVVISQYFGAKQEDKVRATVHTSIVMTLVLGVVLSLLGVFVTPTMLRFMNTPAQVFPESKAYLTIYFAGMMGLMLYNMGSGILRAVGDSRRPFYFLVVSAVLNIVLDLLFVLGFHMGVEGVAYATILSQAVSALLVLLTLAREQNWVRLELRLLCIDWPILWKIIRVGIPAALQLAVTAFSNVFVQSYINFFGPDYMSGWTAYTKIDQLIVLPMQSLALAATTFVGQNLGIQQVDRAKKGTRSACLIAVAITCGILCVVLPTAPYLVAFFNKKDAVIASGSLFLRCLSPFYVLCCINQVYAAALRGAGNSRTPMLLMLFSFVVFRQCYLFVMANYISNTILPIALGYPAGWLVCSALTLTYYHRVDLSRNRLIDDPFPVEK